MSCSKPIICALTGGPCAGKTCSLIKLKTLLMDAGYNCFTISEVYTLLMNSGCEVVYPPNYSDSCNRERSIECLSRELKLQLDIEDSFLGYASLSDKPVVIIADRGALDLVAYAGEEIFAAILNKLQLNRQALLNRYDIVMHLITAANGAEEFYSNETNAVRKESVVEARLLDQQTLQGWSGHHNIHVIKNEVGGFEAKLQTIESCLVSYLKSIVPRNS